MSRLMAIDPSPPRPETRAPGRVRASKAPRCPQCGSPDIRRSVRRGPLERVLSGAYIYPFRCRGCQARFRLMRWGTRYDRGPPLV